MYSGDCTIVEAGVDWLTASTRSRVIYDKFHEVFEREPRKPYAAYGFAGFSIPSGRTAIDGDGNSFIQISGGLAQRYFPQFMEVAENVGRLDVQVTVKTPTYQPEIARDVAKIVVNHQIDVTQKRGAIKLPAPRLERTFGKGDTFYLGKRSSDNFSRIYDKWQESDKAPEYENCWRFEVEFKNATSFAAANALRGDLAHISDHSINMVYSWYAQRGYSAFWRNKAKNVTLPTINHISDEQTKLNWLENQVQPTVRHLVSSGYIDMVAAALRIDTHFLDYLRSEVEI